MRPLVIIFGLDGILLDVLIVSLPVTRDKWTHTKALLDTIKRDLTAFGFTNDIAINDAQ